MANESGDKSPRPATRQSLLVPAMLAIALAVAAQLALRDGLTLLGLAGYVVAAWLFISSVRTIFDAPPIEKPAPAAVESVPAEQKVAPTETSDGASKLRYLRSYWRQVTMAEIFTGDIPPARLMANEEMNGAVEIDAGLAAEVALVTSAAAQEDTATPESAAEAVPTDPPVTEAQMQGWAAADSATAESATSAPTAVKVTPQGDVLVLDAGLEQVQRFDEQGNLLATYSLAGLADMHVLDLDVSPDGQTLYIVDAASSQLQVITLTDHDLTADAISGDAGGELEEE